MPVSSRLVNYPLLVSQIAPPPPTSPITVSQWAKYILQRSGAAPSQLLPPPPPHPSRIPLHVGELTPVLQFQVECAYHTIPYQTFSFHTVSYHSKPYYTNPRYTIPNHAILYYVTPSRACHFIPYSTTPHHSILYYSTTTTVPRHWISAFSSCRSKVTWNPTPFLPHRNAIYYGQLKEHSDNSFSISLYSYLRSGLRVTSRRWTQIHGSVIA